MKRYLFAIAALLALLMTFAAFPVFAQVDETESADDEEPVLPEGWTQDDYDTFFYAWGSYDTKSFFEQNHTEGFDGRAVIDYILTHKGLLAAGITVDENGNFVFESAESDISEKEEKDDDPESEQKLHPLAPDAARTDGTGEINPVLLIAVAVGIALSALGAALISKKEKKEKTK